MLALLIAFAAPTLHCPPDAGQIRWQSVPVQTGDYALKVSIWDTNQDGTPSAGDLAHVDAAQRAAVDLQLDESWFRAGADFAAEVAPKIAGIEPVCEARPAVTAAPAALKAVKSLTRPLDAAYKPVIARKKRIDYMRDRMLRWGQKICRDKKFRPHGEVAQLLVNKAAKTFDDLDGPTVNDTALDVARHASISCTKVAEQTLSF